MVTESGILPIGIHSLYWTYSSTPYCSTNLAPDLVFLIWRHDIGSWVPNDILSEAIVKKKYQFGDTNRDPNWVHLPKVENNYQLGVPIGSLFYRDDVLGFSLFLVLSSPNLGSKLVSFRPLCIKQGRVKGSTTVTVTVQSTAIMASTTVLVWLNPGTRSQTIAWLNIYEDVSHATN
jgi:hypothetical protein